MDKKQIDVPGRQGPALLDVLEQDMHCCSICYLLQAPLSYFLFLQSLKQQSHALWMSSCEPFRFVAGLGGSLELDLLPGLANWAELHMFMREQQCITEQAPNVSVAQDSRQQIYLFLCEDSP